MGGQRNMDTYNTSEMHQSFQLFTRQGKATNQIEPPLTGQGVRERERRERHGVHYIIADGAGRFKQPKNASLCNTIDGPSNWGQRCETH